MSLRAKRHDRTGRTRCLLFLDKTSVVSPFKIFLFVAVRSLTADGGLPQPTGCVKTTPHTSIFAVCLQGILVQNKFDALTTSEFGTQNDKPNNMWNDLKHVETHEYIEQWLVGAVDWSTAEPVCFWSFFLVVSVSVPWLFSFFRWSHTALAQVRTHPTFTHTFHVSSRCERCFIHFFSFLIISDHLALPSARQLQLPRCGGQIPCAHLLRTLAPWPRTSLPHSYEKGNLRKSYWSTVGRRFSIGNAYSCAVNKGYSYLCMWMTSNWLERNKTLFRCGKYLNKKSIWENQHLSLMMCTWGVLKDNVK